MDLGSISPMLKRMEKKGLVVRAERVNDFAAPGDINLVCGSVVY
jgi:DNA-binding PadR family transcriptional regulator